MREAIAKEISKEQKLFVDMWGLLKKYYFINVEDDWTTVCNDLFNIVNDYSEDKKTKILAQDMSFAILDYLNRLAKERQLKL